MKASELAAALGSALENSSGDIELNSMSTLGEAGSTGLSFVTDKKFLAQLAGSQAGVVLIPEKLAPVDRPYIPLKDVWAGVLKALESLYPNALRREYSGVHASATIHPDARLADDVTVAPNAVIGADTEIAAGCYIGPGVVIGAGCRLGENVTIYANAVIEAGSLLGSGIFVQPGAVIGADGFKYEIIGGRWTKIPQVGHVELADHVEVGANSCVDRASYSATVIGRDTKLDNLVQVAHNANIGNNCVIVAQSGVAGSTSIGNNSILAAQTGVADNLKIGDRVIVMAQAGVKNDVPAGQTLFGTPAIPFAEEARIIAASKRLPQLQSEVKSLSKRLEALEAELAELRNTKPN